MPSLVAMMVSGWLLAPAADRVPSCVEARPTPPRAPSKTLSAPAPTRTVTPMHPAHLRKTEGVVVLDVVVSEKGEVESVCVAKSLAPELDLEAARAVRQWRFRPTKLSGQPVKVTTSVSLSFRKR